MKSRPITGYPDLSFITVLSNRSGRLSGSGRLFGAPDDASALVDPKLEKWLWAKEADYEPPPKTPPVFASWEAYLASKHEAPDGSIA
jgi:hypothetical protein